MITGKVLGDELSLLGFGTMRLPLKEDGTIDEPQVAEMTAYAIEHGFQYGVRVLHVGVHVVFHALQYAVVYRGDGIQFLDAVHVIYAPIQRIS